MNDLMGDLRWRWMWLTHNPLERLRQWWCGKRGHGPYWVKEMPRADLLWQSVRCRRCGATIATRHEPNPEWWAARQQAFREEWESR